MTELLFLIVGLAIGSVVSLIIIKSIKAKLNTDKAYWEKDKLQLSQQLESEKRLHEDLKNQFNQLKEEHAQQILKIGNLELQLSNSKENLEQQKQDKSGMESKLENLQQKFETESEEISKLKIMLSERENKNQNLQDKLETQKGEIENIQEKFSVSFKNLANEILEDKSTRFTKLNQQNLDAVLAPLQEKIKEFQSTVRQTNKDNLLSNNSLIEQINHLKEMNQQISVEANNLTKALKGDVKVQGNWGEVILERILEESGLRKGEGYETQSSFTNEQGKRYQPDVVVHLPDSKHIIVDSKVSLIHYENFVVAENDDDLQKSLKLLSVSIKAHIDGLHKKHYHEISELNSPDYVFLFMPIEGSFITVMQNDNELYKYALERHIMIASPSTLLATLRTIAFIWRQENQTKNALEIARQSGALYDKFEGFLADLENIGKNVDRTKDAYDNAVKKLRSGKGNLVGRVEKLKLLGAKANKSIPEKYLNIED